MLSLCFQFGLVVPAAYKSDFIFIEHMLLSIRSAPVMQSWKRLGYDVLHLGFSISLFLKALILMVTPDYVLSVGI